MTAGDDVWEDLFHGCAWAAYLEVWHSTGQFPPDSEATRQRAYQMYEEALAEKNRRKQPQVSGRPLLREAGQGCEAPEGAGVPRQQSPSPDETNRAYSTPCSRSDINPEQGKESYD